LVATTSIAALGPVKRAAGQRSRRVAAAFANWLQRWRGAKLGTNPQAWLPPPTRGNPVSAPEGEGTFAGLDETGALRLKLAGGGIRLVHAGDVFLL
jgi:BirA family biotin operon repressor/biotin-[acetyl-CoA-carboxylase] ligase